MIPFIVLVITTLILRVIGAAGVALLNSWTWSLRGGLALMFLFTASAHWGKRRGDLVAMVPSAFPRPDLMVSATGVLEILGAVGLLIPAIAPLASAGLALLLISLFPANVRAAREGLTIGGRPATALPLRTVLQLVFLVAVLAAGLPGVFPFGVR
ncbi:MAG TPA: DoxX family protein [Bryobacteraceae bacterium]|nr:DoxX family protein [Bryobacteraceae bacterium]